MGSGYSWEASSMKLQYTKCGYTYINEVYNVLARLVGINFRICHNNLVCILTLLHSFLICFLKLKCLLRFKPRYLMSDASSIDSPMSIQVQSCCIWNADCRTLYTSFCYNWHWVCFLKTIRQAYLDHAVILIRQYMNQGQYILGYSVSRKSEDH